jgi:hypothetical protein
MTMFRTKQRRLWIAALTVGVILFAVGAALQAHAHGPKTSATTVAAPVEQVSVANVTPVSSITPTPAAQGHQTLIAAIGTYMHSSTEVDTFTLEDEQIVGDMVRVLVVPPPDVTDSAFLFAREGADGWTVLSIGTWFPQEFYLSENIPTELWVQ